MRRLVEFLGLKAGVAAILAMVILVGTGNKMAERFLPIYLLALGGGPIAIGFLNALHNLLSALYALLGGYLADRFGAKRSLFIFNLMAVIGYLIVIAVPSWSAVIVGALFFISWGAISLPATMDLIFNALPATRRTMGVSMHALVARIPMGLGPVIGGVMIDRWGAVEGIRVAFSVAMIMAILSMLIQQRLVPEDAAHPVTHPSDRFHFNMISQIKFPTALRKLLTADILVRFCEQIPYAFVVVWCMKAIDSPVTASQFGILTAIEMATAMAVYVPVAYYADRGSKRPFVAVTFVFFALFPIVLLFCRSFEWLVAAFMIRGLKEFGEPSRKALIMELAPDHARASSFGLYYLIRDSIVSVGAFAGAFLWQINPTINLLTAAAFGLLAAAWFARAGAD